MAKPRLGDDRKRATRQETRLKVCDNSGCPRNPNKCFSAFDPRQTHLRQFEKLDR